MFVVLIRKCILTSCSIFRLRFNQCGEFYKFGEEQALHQRQENALYITSSSSIHMDPTKVPISLHSHHNPRDTIISFWKAYSGHVNKFLTW
eukprot:c40130_g1_i1 orf=49-321(-)